jgi:DNA-binding LacI/PurR family transcriptional regulator
MFRPKVTRPTIPVRTYLPAVTAEVILRRQAEGNWSERLPGERGMCEALQVSRGTLRQALHILHGRGLLETHAGRGHRLLVTPKGAKKPPTHETIRFLSPEPLESRRAFFSLMLDKLHEAADARGWLIRRDHGTGYFGSKAGTRLKELVVGGEDHCWILVHANRSVQEWFQKRKLPTIVSGHTFPGVLLPSMDVDHYAAGRHAAGVLLRHRHHSVAMVVSTQPLQGLREGERGFIEAFGAQKHRQRRITRLIHDGVDADFIRQIRKLFTRADRPTAVLVETPNQYITVLSSLAELRMVVPDDVSLLSRLDDPFMPHFSPVPARYQLDPNLFSRTLATLIAHLLAGESLHPRTRKIMPEFITGKSVAAPAGTAP